MQRNTPISVKFNNTTAIQPVIQTDTIRHPPHEPKMNLKIQPFPLLKGKTDRYLSPFSLLLIILYVTFAYYY